ncbi:conserved protein of unknown function [Shewanella benthica]|uniref:Uncharacterized protein n=1 Tax=Shewanella benthica TaxID=43661 RepID=A0A330M514_9GAMM|nr:conserved protein of unknown function [Shewanella benthica]
MAPPESISNSEVKRNCADGSVGSPHVRVGHFQAPNILYNLAVKFTFYVEHKTKLSIEE